METTELLRQLRLNKQVNEEAASKLSQLHEENKTLKLIIHRILLKHGEDLEMESGGIDPVKANDIVKRQVVITGDYKVKFL